jgi:hypothetical protein
MNSIIMFFKTLLFLPAVTLLNASMLITIVWITLKTGGLTWGQLLGRLAGRNGDAAKLGRTHLFSIREAVASHSARLAALQSWCFTRRDAKRA